ncbi:MAG: transposase [Verrucomicrobia bacterium]|nr:transposase [Verrucomicrobiota bacterium]
MNSNIQSLKAAARGFRSFRNYRIRILLFCGKLDLYPLYSVKKRVFKKWNKVCRYLFLWLPA